MKRLFSILAIVTVLFAVSCKKETSVPVSGVTLSETSISIVTGESETLVATVLPENATNKNVLWSVDDDTIISVDTEGNVTALSRGVANIIVTTEEGGFKAECEVVVANPKATETIIMDKDGNSVTGTYVVTVGDEFEFTAKVLPDNYNQEDWSWKYDLNQDVLSITEGTTTNFKALKAGKVTLSVSPSTYDSSCKIASVEIEVRDPLTLTLATDCVDNVYGGGSTMLVSNYELKSCTCDLDRTEIENIGVNILIHTGYYTNKSGLPVDRTAIITATDDAGREAKYTVNVKGWRVAIADAANPSVPFDFASVKLTDGQKLLVAMANANATMFNPFNLVTSLIDVNYDTNAYDATMTSSGMMQLTVKAGASSYDIIVYNKYKYNQSNSYSKAAIMTFKSAGM